MIRIAAVAVLLSAGRVLAADAAYTPPAAPAAPDVTGLVVRLFGMTAVMLVLCGGVVWGLRRAKRPAAAKGDAGRLRHDGSLQLDRRSAVHLIRADGQTVAVTTDVTGLRSLVVLSEPFEKELEAAEAAPESG